MLSYRHAFHAGNHADALKHIALIECLRRLSVKEKPFFYVDTHAGAGFYRLEEGYAARNREWEGGFGRLEAYAEASPPAPEAVASYLALVRAWRAAGHGPDAYPGSPAIAMELLRPRDSAAFFELHPSDHESLAAAFAGDGRTRVRKADGCAGLAALLPPPSRRGLAFLDPSYELDGDYDALVDGLARALSRFATGTYCVWYPLLESSASRHLPGKLSSLSDRPVLHASLRVRSASEGARGMSGSGLVLVNPPWGVREKLAEALPYLSAALGTDSGSSWDLRTERYDD